MGYREKLAEMGANWGTNKSGVQKTPPGKYSMQLQLCELAESNNGNLMVKREHYILEGEHAGQVVFDNIVLSSDFGQQKLSEFIQKMGYEVPEAIEDCEETISAIGNATPKYVALVKVKDDFTNVDVLELLGEDEAPSKPSKPAAKPTAKPTAKASTPTKGKVIPMKKVEEEVEEEPSHKFGLKTQVKFKGEDGVPIIGTVTDHADGGEIVVTTKDGDAWQVPEDSCVGLKESFPDEEEATEEVAEETQEESETPDVSVLIAFAQAHDIDVEEDWDYEKTLKKLQLYQFPRHELTEEEITLCEQIGVETFEEKKKPEPKPAPKGKATASKPAAKPTAKASVKPAPKKPVSKK